MAEELRPHTICSTKTSGRRLEVSRGHLGAHVEIVQASKGSDPFVRSHSADPQVMIYGVISVTTYLQTYLAASSLDMAPCPYACISHFNSQPTGLSKQS